VDVPLSKPNRQSHFPKRSASLSKSATKPVAQSPVEVVDAPDQNLVRIAQRICDTHFEVHKQAEQPIGVVVHQISHRGQLIFNTYPALLLHECFISIDQIEAHRF